MGYAGDAIEVHQLILAMAIGISIPYVMLMFFGE